jgi:hypothetical protein
VYKQMAKYNGFPRVYWQGEHDLISNGQKIRSNVMIMDILGDSLEKLNQNRNFIVFSTTTKGTLPETIFVEISVPIFEVTFCCYYCFKNSLNKNI